MVVTMQAKMAKHMARKYIQIYNEVRSSGESIEKAFVVTKIKFQDYIIKQMLEKPAQISIIAKIYENIKLDKSLQEKALISYDLSLCNEDIKAKYMPLVMQ